LSGLLAAVILKDLQAASPGSAQEGERDLADVLDRAAKRSHALGTSALQQRGQGISHPSSINRHAHHTPHGEQVVHQLLPAGVWMQAREVKEIHHPQHRQAIPGPAQLGDRHNDRITLPIPRHLETRNRILLVRPGQVNAGNVDLPGLWTVTTGKVAAHRLQVTGLKEPARRLQRPKAILRLDDRMIQPKPGNLSFNRLAIPGNGLRHHPPRDFEQELATNLLLPLPQELAGLLKQGVQAPHRAPGNFRGARAHRHRHEVPVVDLGIDELELVYD